ncbi:hypothetical protein E5L59_05020 [Helicobacter pylori]|nr:hypothetical protein E5L59_05020 [Helicobacter pylori]
MAKIHKRAEFRLLIGMSVLVVVLGISFIVAVCFSFGALGISFIVAVCFSFGALANG